MFDIEQPGNSKKLTKKFTITKIDCTSKCHQVMKTVLLLLDGYVSIEDLELNLEARF